MKLNLYLEEFSQAREGQLLWNSALSRTLYRSGPTKNATHLWPRSLLAEVIWGRGISSQAISPALDRNTGLRKVEGGNGDVASS